MPEVLSIFENKKFRVCYWDTENRFVGSDKLLFEQRLAVLGDVRVVALKSLDEENFHPCQLLIIAAHAIAEADFQNWLKMLESKIANQGKIWVPTLILSSLTFSTLDAMLVRAAKSNWYFDIISRDHLDSMPIRVANLLRIGEHLLELHRYNEMVLKLEARTNELEKNLAKLLDPKSKSKS